MPTVPWHIGRDLIEQRAGPFPARRSLYACAAVICGYTLPAFFLPAIPSLYWLSAAPALLIAAMFLKGRACQVVLCLSLAAFAAGWYAARINERARASIAWGVDDEVVGIQPLLTTVRGVIADVPAPTQPPRGALARFAPPSGLTRAVSFTLTLSAVESDPGKPAPASGNIRVRIDGSSADMPAHIRPGAALSLTGRLRPVKAASNPGEPDWLSLAAQAGRIGDMSVSSTLLITERDPEGFLESALAAWHSTIGALHARCVRAIDGAPASDPATVRSRALLGALLLGQRDAALDDVNNAFTRLGLVHLVAISGFNLALMALFAVFVLRLTGDRGWLEPAIIAALVALYMLVLPAQAPILRAGFLVLAILIADALGRRYDRAALMGWIAILLLIYRPMDAWSLGFQLSFGIVAALLLLGTTVHHRLWGVPIRGLSPPHEPHGRLGLAGWLARAAHWLSRWLTRFFKAQISASILAWAISIPIIACHTGQISLLTPILSLIILPLVVILLWCGYLALLVGVLIPPAAGLATGALDALASVLVNVVLSLDRIPGASAQLPRISTWWALAAVAVVVSFILRGTLRDKWSWAMVGALAAWLGAEMNFGTRLSPSTALRIDTLAVGDGACHVIRAKGDAALWDCGSLSTSIGVRVVPDALRALGVWRISTAVITHPHLDHFSALPDIAGEIGLKRIYLPPQFTRAAALDPTGAPAAFLAEMTRRNIEVIPISQGSRIELAGIPAAILWPPREQTFRDPNDCSLVAMLEAPTLGTARRVLLTGDAAKEAIPSLLPAPGDAQAAAALRADILELPHHGAFIPPAVELVHVVDPSVVLQSTGPSRAADMRWATPLAGRAWYSTPRQGAAYVEITTKGGITSGSYR